MLEKNLSDLILSWKERLGQNYGQEYKDALNDCIYELDALLCEDRSKEELSEQDLQELHLMFY